MNTTNQSRLENTRKETRHWKLAISDDSIATLHFDTADSSTNGFSAQALDEFEQMLLHVLRQREAKLGIATQCIGGGQGGAMLLSR
jgi:GTP cyclohydrolase III